MSELAKRFLVWTTLLVVFLFSLSLIVRGAKAWDRQLDVQMQEERRNRQIDAEDQQRSNAFETWRQHEMLRQRWGIPDSLACPAPGTTIVRLNDGRMFRVDTTATCR